MYINVLSLSYMSKLYVQFLFVVILITSQHENIISDINNRPSFSCFVKNIEISFYHFKEMIDTCYMFLSCHTLSYHCLHLYSILFAI